VQADSFLINYCAHATSGVCTLTLAFRLALHSNVGRDSSVGLATRYGLDGTGIVSRGGGEIFRTRPDRHWGPLSILHNGYRVFLGGNEAGAWH